MREAQHATMTQTYTVMYNTNSGPRTTYSEDLFQKRLQIWGLIAASRKPAAETPADLRQVTGERLSLRALPKPQIDNADWAP